MSSVLTTAVSGMNAAVARILNAAKNIVNVSSTGRLPSSQGGAATSYQPTDVITLSNNVGDNQLGVRAQTVLRDPAYYPVRDPNNADANEQGLIAAPNVDLTAEIVDTIMARAVYQANAKMIAAEKRNEETLIDTMA